MTMEEMNKNEVQEQEESVPAENDTDPWGCLYVVVVIVILVAAFVRGVVID